MEKVVIEKRILLSFDAIYGNGVVNPKILLKDVPRTAAIEFISYILHLYNVRKKDDHEFHSYHLIQWMMQMDEQENIIKFLEKEKALIYSSSFSLIDRRSCLDLIQYILIYSDAVSNNHPLNKSHYTLLFKCLLYFNSSEIAAQKMLFDEHEDCSIDEFASYILTVQIKNIEHERFKDFKIQFLKVYYFFSFCESHEKYAIHLNTFLSSLGLTSYRGYLWNLISPYLKMMVNEPPTPKMHIAADSTTLHFYKQFVINDKIFIPEKDYKPLRKFPLYNSGPNLFVYMDFRFFVDKFYQSFLFDFAAKIDVPYNVLKTDMGNEFSEHILFYTIMEKCFGNYGDIRLKGDEIKAKLTSGEPDFYIRENAKIYLFEFKDVGLTAETKYSGDPEKIKKGIFEKLERNYSGKKKGITQLLSTIKEISSGSYGTSLIDELPAGEIIIYPVIIHTDITFESAGVNYFLNKRFEVLLAESESLSHKVKQLTLINLDTLILFQEHFLNGKLDLGICIDSYIEYISVNDGKTATFPFDEFIKYYFVKEHKEKIGYPKDFDLLMNSFKTIT